MSNFGNDKIENPESLNFNKATKLPGGGSTCDIYVTNIDMRKVFVKKLKDQYKNKPLYRTAFAKEFEIGANLKHYSLPTYIQFHDDYIVMEYIEGKTLEALIKEKDLWLGKEKNVVRILQKLLEVVDYLHQNNVVHCDIKADNIIITNNGHNLMLIDLDKCHTDWLDSTSGAPSKYGLSNDKRGKMDMDLHCIALILEKIIAAYPRLQSPTFKDVIKACKSENITADDVLDILNSNSRDVKSDKASYLKTALFTSLFLILTAIVVLSVILFNNNNRQSNSQGKIGTEENLAPQSSQDTVVIIQETSVPVTMATVGNSPEENLTKAELTMEEKGRILDEIYLPFVKKLDSQLAELQEYQKDSTLTFGEMMDHIQDFADGEDNYVARMWQLVQETFPETHETDVAAQIVKSKVYSEYMHRSDSIQRSYSTEMIKRRKVNN